MKPNRILLLACFFVSGLCGLIYQIVWMRLIGFVFGNSVYATATVLAAFMGGLAVGSFFGGRVADRCTNRVRLYGILEIVIGVYCILLPLLLSLATPLYAAVYQHSEGTSGLLTIIRAVICGALLILPTTCMGATLPILLRHFVEDGERLGRTVGLVYAVNTFGAVAGCVAAGFLLVPALGINKTIIIAVILNLVVGIYAVAVGKAPDEYTPEEPESEDARSEVAGLHYSGWEAKAALIVFGLSGFCAMVDEVALTRAFSLLVGSSTYAFTIMLTAFISGIGIGSLLLARKIDPRRDLLFGIALVQMGIGACMLLAVILISEFPKAMVHLILRFQTSFGMLQFTEFLYLFLLLLAPTALMGVMFPLTTAVWTRSVESVGKSSGEAYFVNTLGAIFGSLAAGFLLLPILGVQLTLESAALLNFAAAGFVFFASKRRKFIVRVEGGLAALVVGLVFLAIVPRWSLEQFTSGAYLYAAKVQPGDDLKQKLADMAREQGKILNNRDGSARTVTVKEFRPGHIKLAVNGKVDATSKGDMTTQKLLGHIPMLAHSNPKEVLVIGLGSGMSLGAVLTYDPDRADCVEISREVVEAVELFFPEYNYDCLNNRATHLYIGDGRNHVTLNDRTYDVITSEPSNPWIAGIGNLFTIEFWEQCRQLLNDDGVMCQWLQTYQMNMDSFAMIMRTFRSVFPNCSIWYTSSLDLILIGSKKPLRLTLKEIDRRLTKPKVRADLAMVDITDARTLLTHFITDSRGLDQIGGEGDLHRDDNSRLEFDMPRSLYRSSITMFQVMDAVVKSPQVILKEGAVSVAEADRLMKSHKASWHYNYARMHIRSIELQEALKQFQLAHNTYPENKDYLLELFRMLYATARESFKYKKTEMAILALDQLRPLYSSMSALYEESPDLLAEDLKEFDSIEKLFGQIGCNLGVLRLTYPAPGTTFENRIELAVDAYRFALSCDSESKQANTNMGSLLIRQKRFKEALPHLEKALEKDPGASQLLFNQGVALENLGKEQEALSKYLESVKENSKFWAGFYRLGVIYEKLNQPDKARENYQKALRIKPKNRLASAKLKALQEKKPPPPEK